MQHAIAHRQSLPQSLAAIGWLVLISVMLCLSQPAPAQSLPGAPSFKKGIIKRDKEGSVVLDGKDRDSLAELTKGHFEKAVGTGFFVSKAGHILTNQHVIEGCPMITAQDVNGQTVLAKVIKENEPLDLAVLRSNAKPPVVARFRLPDNRLRRNARLRTHGYPTLTLTPVHPQETDLRLLEEKPGISRMVMRGELFPGNSGGPIMDMDGRIVGVAVAKINTVALYKKTGLLIEDISYAVSGGAAFEFLSRNGVTPQTASGSAQVPGDDNKIVVRIGCWN